jgi:hypothetical protein
MRYAPLAAVVVFAAVATIGCGTGGGPERAVVSGQVTFRGEPVANGEIRFEPAQGTRANVCGASIRDGRYRIANKGGVPVGTYRVILRGFRPAGGTSRQRASGDPMSGEGPAVQYLPQQYNERSTLTVTIESGGRDQTRDFRLD